MGYNKIAVIREGPFPYCSTANLAYGSQRPVSEILARQPGSVKQQVNKFQAGLNLQFRLC